MSRPSKPFSVRRQKELDFLYRDTPRRSGKPRPRVDVVGLTYEYLDATNDSARMRPIQILESAGRSSALAVAGELLLDKAMRTGVSRSGRVDLLQRAIKNWEASIDRAPYFTPHVGRACLQLAHLGIYGRYVIDGDRPSAEDTQRVVAAVPDLGKRYGQLVASASVSPVTKSTAIGDSGELAVIGLLGRDFGRSGSTELFAVPSLISEDRGQYVRSQDALRSGWDITVLCQHDDETTPTVTYRAQVKTGRNANRTNYEEGIAVINVTTDLPGIEEGAAASPIKICHEIARELRGDDSVTEQLNARTEQLFTRLDEQS